MSDTLLTSGLREGEQVEFKSQWVDKALEDLCAFANTRGGNLFVGVNDDGSVAGLSGSDKEMQSVANKVSESLGLSPRIAWLNEDGKQVLVVSVGRSDWLVSLRGRHLVRVGSTNREMPKEDVAQRIMRQVGSSWDALPSDAGIEAIDPDAVRRFAQMVADLNRGRLPHLDSAQSVETVLDKLALLRDDRVTNAGVLLFGIEPQRSYRTALVRIARIQDGEIMGEHLQGGDLFKQLDGVFEALRTRFLDVRFEMRPIGSGVAGLQREEVWEYPYVALREALNNAVVHRDYTTAGDIQIRVYDDRMEIWNPGPLINDLDPALLRIDPHPSRRRNELLADVFYKAGLIERWGTGTLRMIKTCKQQGLPEPEFVDKEGGGFKVVFRKDQLSPEILRRLELNERQVHAVLHLKSVGTLTNSQYQELTGIEKRTASRDLAELVERGLVERVGATGRGVKYRLAR